MEAVEETGRVFVRNLPFTAGLLRHPFHDTGIRLSRIRVFSGVGALELAT